MKKLLIFILLLANLCSGLAFAWDNTPAGAMTAHDTSTFVLQGDDQPHLADSTLHQDNHYCHGASHSMGIIYNAEVQITTGSQTEHAFSIVAIPSRYLSPHLRPPIV